VLTHSPRITERQCSATNRRYCHVFIVSCRLLLPPAAAAGGGGGDQVAMVTAHTVRVKQFNPHGILAIFLQQLGIVTRLF